MKSLRKAIVPGAAIAGFGLLAVGSIATIVGSIFLEKRRAQLRGKVVLITGGSRGLGLALAEEFGRAGAKLVLAARDLEELHRARELLTQRASVPADRILTVKSDLRESEQADALIDRATGYFGRVDILINNAGIITVGPVEHQTGEIIRDVMNTNFFSAVHCSLAVLPQMLARRTGTIVNIASLGGKVAVPHLIAYTASKFAEVGFSQGLHAELRSKGIQVLTVCPGLMRTGSHMNALFSGDAEREYRWFSLLANLPGLAVSPQHAARRIVRAVLMKETEIAISPQAALAVRLGPAMPGLTARAMRVAERLLPKPAGHGENVRRGSQARNRELWPSTKLGPNAAQRYNQLS